MAREIDIRGLTFVHSKGKLICLEPVCLDIETSNNHAENVEDLITWVSSIQVYFNGHYFFLRRPEQLVDFYNYLYTELELIQEPPHIERRIYTFIHNAQYDLSYLIPYFRKYLPYTDGEPVGIIDGPNKILTYTQGSLEFRCTYRLTGVSLSKWTEELNVEHKKLVGMYDYDKVIYQDDTDAFTVNELDYDKNDVIGLYEALMKHNEYVHHDTLASMPLTLTGYCRRDLRRSCKRNPYYRQKYFLDNRLDAELYYCFLKSFSGGYTHNNRFYKDITIKVGNKYRFCNEEIRVHNIGHRDFKSHYPTQMTYLYPLGPPQLIYDSKHDFRDPPTIEELIDMYPKFYTMSVVRVTKAELRDKRISMPFMQFSKLHEAHFTSCRQDNGRIIYASGSFIMFCDNLLLQILNEQYDMDYEIVKTWRIKAEPLPPEILNVVDMYFKGKSDKKNIVEQLEAQYGKTDIRCLDAQIDLSTAKKLLNALFGCTAMNPLRNSYTIDNGMNYRLEKSYGSLEDMQNGLDEYYDKRNNFLSYMIGCTVTSLAKMELYEFITKGVGYNKVLYCDTDSIYYIKDAKTERAIERLNAEKRKHARYVVLDNGNKEYYDVFSKEPDCIAFKGLHSKCYGIVTSKGLELTIAGVPARTITDIKEDGTIIYTTREQELQGNIQDPVKALDNLTDSFKFYINTGKSAVYIGAVGGIDGPHEPMLVNVNGHIVSTAGGCVIKQLKEKQIHDMEYDLMSYEYEDMTIYEDG